MKELKFPLLTAEDIEVRVQNVKPGSGFSLLLYKTARTDAKILDKVVGVFNWQKKFYELKGHIYCSIGIYNEDRNEWVWKDDAGAESAVEKEKGEASDSTKRAGFVWGIGRSLYTAPFIWVKETADITSKKRFEVSEIAYNENEEISALTIIESDSGTVVYRLGGKKTYTSTKAPTNDKTPTETPKVAQTSQNSGFKVEKGSVSDQQKIILASYISGLDTSRSQRFLSYMDKTYGTMNYEMLSEKQADELIRLTLPKDKR